MRKSFIKTLVALMMAATMLVGLAGCGKKETTETPEKENTTNAIEEKKDDTAKATPEATAEATPEVDLTKDPYGKYETPVSISTLSVDWKSGGTEYDSSNPERKSASENAWITAYADYLNINLDRQIAENYDALNALINTSMASGTLPDIMMVDKSMFYTLVENDVLADLSDVYENYSSVYGRLLTQVTGSNPDAMNSVVFDGKMLAVPCISNSYINSDVLWVRQDWLDKLNMDPPKTLDELKTLAKAFKDNKLGGENTIGLGLYDISRSLMAPFGAIPGIWEKGDDGKYVNDSTTEEMKNGLLFLQGLYSEGLIKKDFSVTNILDQEVANGEVGMFYSPAWCAVTNIKSNMLNDANAEWTPVRIPTLDGNPVKQWTNNSVDTYFVVNKDCKNPEAIFKMLELELHMQYEGTDEEVKKYVTCDDGFAMWDLRPFRNFTRADYGLNCAELIAEAVEKKTPVDEVPSFIRVNYEKTLKGLDGDREMVGMKMTQLDAYPIIMQVLKEDNFVTSYNGPLTENMSLYKKTIDDALTNEFLKIVMGDDISNFDKAVSDWYANGGEKITEEINDYYKSIGK